MARGFWIDAVEEPDRLAVVAPDGAEITAGDLLAECNRLTHGLRALGLTPGDGIAVVMPNGIELMALYFAAMQSGWYLTPINHHLVGPEIAYIVDDCDAKVFIGHERFAEACRAAADEFALGDDHCFAVGEVAGFRPWSDLTAGQPDTAPADRTAGQPMHYTSGTTGKPKGVRRQLSGLAPDDAGMLFTFLLQLFGIAPDDGHVHICGSPLYHTAVLAFASSSVHLGHTVVLMDKWTPEGMLECIDRYGVTHSHMVPTQFNRLLALPDDVKDRYDVSSLRNIVHAAAPCPIDVKRRMLEWWGPVIYEYYAATEGGGTLIGPEEWLERPGSVGTAWASSEIRILDDDGNDVPTGETGTVYMKLASATFEYHKNAESTEANRREGFFTVGDIGYLDDAGYLFLCDRKSDMIISGGVNIYPAEIEGELHAHPKVADVAVFGIPHPDWGEEVKAVVQPVDDVVGDDALVDELTEWCSARLAKFKIPRSFDFADELPRDPNGKLYKRKLRDPYWEGRDTAI